MKHNPGFSRGSTWPACRTTTPDGSMAFGSTLTSMRTRWLKACRRCWPPRPSREPRSTPFTTTRPSARYGSMNSNRWRSVARIAQGIAEHGMAFAHWAELIGTSDTDALDRFEDAYLGHYDSLEDYAQSMIDDFGLEEEIGKTVPEFLAPYVQVDFEGFGRDMEFSGDVTTSAGDGGIYIFDGTI